MSKPKILAVDYLNLEINSETMKRYEKCEQSTQSMPIEHCDIATDAYKGSMAPPIRPPPLRINKVTSLDSDIHSIGSSTKFDKDHTFKGKMKMMKNGTIKVTQEMCSKMVNRFKGGIIKHKSKKADTQSPQMKTSTLVFDYDNRSTNIKKTKSLTYGHSVKELVASPKVDARPQLSATKEVTKYSVTAPISEIVSETSILLSYPIMSQINQYIKENSDDLEEETMEDLFQHWITEFIDTCQRQIKNVILSTNNGLAQTIDLNAEELVPGNHNFINVNTIPTWTQVRILQDSTKQKYIALRKSHSLSWFILPRETPKLSQRWVCYPIDSMNTFENELRLAEENSIQWLLLRMIILKCFNKIYKNDIVPIKFDINNILLVSSTCGLIVVFKECVQDLDVASLKILKCETLADVPKQWVAAKTEVRDGTMKFFYRLNIISVLISSIWPLDYLAYILARLMMESDN